MENFIKFRTRYRNTMFLMSLLCFGYFIYNFVVYDFVSFFAVFFGAFLFVTALLENRRLRELKLKFNRQSSQFDKTYNKPPLGVTPKFIWEEQREAELRQGIERYIKSNYLVDPEWTREHNKLSAKIAKRNLKNKS
jgi:hypothetical protein